MRNDNIVPDITSHSDDGVISDFCFPDRASPPHGRIWPDHGTGSDRSIDPDKTSITNSDIIDVFSSLRYLSDERCSMCDRSRISESEFQTLNMFPSFIEPCMCISMSIWYWFEKTNSLLEIYAWTGMEFDILSEHYIMIEEPKQWVKTPRDRIGIGSEIELFMASCLNSLDHISRTRKWLSLRVRNLMTLYKITHFVNEFFKVIRSHKILILNKRTKKREIHSRVKGFFLSGEKRNRNFLTPIEWIIVILCLRSIHTTDKKTCLFYRLLEEIKNKYF